MVPELRPRGIGEILDVAVALYRAQFARIVGLAAIVVVPVQVLSTIVLLSAQPDSVDVTLAGTASPQYDSRSFLTQFAAVVTILFVSYVSNAFVVGLCARPVADAYIGHEAAWARGSIGGRGFLPVLATASLVAICELLGLAFCGIGLLVAAAFFAVALPALVLERTSPTGALGRSFTLTKSHFWRVLGVVVTVQFLLSVLNVGLTLAVRLLFLHNAGTSAAVITQGVAGTISALLTTPVLAAVAVALYFDLRIRNEAYDVQLLLQRADARRVPVTAQ